MEQLIDAEAQHVANLGIQPRERPLRGVGYEVIDGAEPAQGTRRELDEQGAVALVGQIRAGLCDCAWKIGTITVDRLQHSQRRDARGGDHENRAPAGIGRPARNSRAVMARLPSGCSARTRSTPSPVATRIASPVASMTVPGSAPGSRVQRPCLSWFAANRRD